MVLIKASAVLLLLSFSLVLINFIGKRYQLHFEVQRKMMHISLGVVSMSFPFLFFSIKDLALVLIVAFIVQLLLRYAPILRQSLGESIFGVKRSWHGGGLFLVSILILFAVSDNNYTLYAGPLLMVTFADAAAAIVGSLYGKRHYKVFGCTKTIEGTSAFIVVGFLCIFMLLTFCTDASMLKCIFIALVVAIVCAIVEVFSFKALDNVTVPASTFLILAYFL
jgi:phytol kinase